jgi:hypothetical protein
VNDAGDEFLVRARLAGGTSCVSLTWWWWWNTFNRLLEAYGDQQANNDGGDVDEELCP